LVRGAAEPAGSMRHRRWKRQTGRQRRIPHHVAGIELDGADRRDVRGLCRVRYQVGAV